MIKPRELNTERGEDIWRIITAAAEGNTEVLGQMLNRDPALSREGYWYTPAIHFAVREGHADAVQILLAAGADPEWNGYYGESLIGMARERGYDNIARILEKNRSERSRTVAAAEDHPIHRAAELGNLRRVRRLLDADPALIHRGDRAGGTPLQRAVIGSARNVIRLLLDRGADVHAIHGTSRGAGSGYGPYDVQAIDLAIWRDRRPSRPPRWRTLLRCVPYWIGTKRRPHSGPRDIETARLLLAHGATYDLTVAAALGDLERVQAILNADPAQIRVARPSGRRPLPAAIEFGHRSIARLLLDRGADPTWPEKDAERGSSLHSAARAGNLPLVKLLLEGGADPNAHVDAAGNAMFVARTPEIRALLQAYGGSSDPYDLVWLGQDDEAVRCITEDPGSAELGCGGIFTAICTRGKRDLLKRVLDAGIRVPPVVTGCQSYLLEQPDMLQTLLEYGMNPDTCNWQQQTLLHQLCGVQSGESPIACARILLDAGADISARDDVYRSTPLAWAARNNNTGMVGFLLSRGAPTSLSDDRRWATPLAWAIRRGHTSIVRMLRAAGAS